MDINVGVTILGWPITYSIWKFWHLKTWKNIFFLIFTLLMITWFQLDFCYLKRIMKEIFFVLISFVPPFKSMIFHFFFFTEAILVEQISLNFHLRRQIVDTFSRLSKTGKENQSSMKVIHKWRRSIRTSFSGYRQRDLDFANMRLEICLFCWSLFSNFSILLISQSVPYLATFSTPKKSPFLSVVKIFTHKISFIL